MSRDTVIVPVTLSGTDIDMLGYAIDSHIMEIEASRDYYTRHEMPGLLAQADEEHAAFSALMQRLQEAKR